MLDPDLKLTALTEILNEVKDAATEMMAHHDMCAPDYNRGEADFAEYILELIEKLEEEKGLIVPD